nr:MAG: hypothetical protein DIU70_13270 [Bacillota bacterium]
MDEKARISSFHLGTLFVTVTLTGLLHQPTVAVESAGRMAWAVSVLSGAAGLLIIHLVGRLGLRFPDETLVGYASRILGRPAGKLLGLILVLVFALNSGAEIRMAIKSAVGVFFITTLTLVIAVLMTLTALMVGWHGVVTASRLGPLLVGSTFVVFFLTFPLLWRWMQPGYLIPLWEFSEIQFRSRPFWVAVFGLRVGALLAAMTPYIDDRRRALRAASAGYLLGWLGNFLAVISPIMVFGPEGARGLSQPFPYVIAIIRLPNFPFERVEMLARLVFNVGVFYAVGIALNLGGRVAAEVFGTTRSRPFMLAVAAISLIPSGWIAQEQPGEAAVAWIIIGTAIYLFTVYPLLWLVYAFRRRAIHAPRAGRRR